MACHGNLDADIYVFVYLYIENACGGRPAIPKCFPSRVLRSTGRRHTRADGGSPRTKCPRIFPCVFRALGLHVNVILRDFWSILKSFWETLGGLGGPGVPPGRLSDQA